MKNAPCFSIFPKFLAHLSPRDLAEALCEAGADAVDLVIRKGFWVEPDNLRQSLPPFLQAVREAQLDCCLCTWGVNPHQVPEKDLKLLADSGIRRFRLGHFPWDPKRPYPTQIDEARQALANLVPLLEKYGMQAIYQFHHNTLVTTPESAAFLVTDLPPEQIGIMPDTGNQLFEGLAWPSRLSGILGPYWSDLGVKDVRCLPGGEREWVPCGEGANDWPALAKAWQQAHPRGVWNLQPFYADSNPTRLLELLRQEIQFLRKQFAP